MNLGSGMSGANVASAIDMWETCATYSSGFPGFVIGQQGDLTINVVLASGRNPDPYAGCGGFIPSNSSGAVAGGTITIYEQPGSSAALSSCSSTYVETIAHDRDGVSNAGGWTRADTEEAFVWTDVNRDEAVNFGELLGTAFLLSDGTEARNGFQVLAFYDRAELGGNGDGFMTKTDEFFHKLRLWVDRDHNGISTPDEISALPASNVVSIGTAFEHVHTSDGNGNTVMLRGTYTTRHGQGLTDRLAEDIGFRVLRK